MPQLNGGLALSHSFCGIMHSTIRTAAPFPVPLDDVVETIRYLQLIKRASPFNT